MRLIIISCLLMIANLVFCVANALLIDHSPYPYLAAFLAVYNFIVFSTLFCSIMFLLPTYGREELLREKPYDRSQT